MKNNPAGVEVILNKKPDEVVRDGYTFLGWSNDKNDTVAKYGDNAPYIRSMDDKSEKEVTLYAVWKENSSVSEYTYTIRYNANGGAGNMSDKTGVKSEIATTLDDNQFTRQHYKFLGWSIASDSEVAEYGNKGSFSKKVNESGVIVTLYAVWSKYTYSINFNGNGASGMMSAMTNLESGVDYSLASMSFIYDNYRFEGWSNTSNGSVQYIDGATFNKQITSNDEIHITLYAIWKRYTYTLKFNANTGSGNMNDITNLKAGETIELPEVEFTKDGYKFIGWAESTAGTVKYANVGPYTRNMDSKSNNEVTLYAIWKESSSISDYTYTIRFNANGGTGKMADMTNVQSDIATKLDDNKFSRVNYKFLGWSETNTDKAAKYDNGAGFSKSVDRDNVVVVLYAIWEVYKYNINYDANGGIGNVNSQNNLNAGSKITLAKSGFTRNGYVLSGWSENKNALTADYSLGLTTYVRTMDSTSNKTVILYAVWSERKVYTVTFNANGGSGKMASQEFVGGVEQALNYNKFSRIGYTFNYWVDQNNKTYSNGQKIKINNDLVLYAVWKIVETKYSGGGSGGGGGGGGGVLGSGINIPNQNPGNTQPIDSYWLYDFVYNRYVVCDINTNLLVGWKYTNDFNNSKTGWRYFTSFGMPIMGWYTDPSGDKYYFDETYMMVTGTVVIDGMVRTFNSNGVLVDKLVSPINNSINNRGMWFYEPILNKWQYIIMQADGSLAIAKNTWFLSNVSGSDVYYAVDKDGYLITGFVKYRGNIYYLAETGADIGKLIANTSIRVYGLDLHLGPEGKVMIDMSLYPYIKVFDMDSL